jgi:hypothetical protein
MKEAAHLIRLAVVLVAAVGLFAVARQSIVPAGFGKYGHFRAGALQDNQTKALAYAGREACGVCHADTATSLQGSRHAAIGCESCHGPQFRHSEEPSAHKVALPNAQSLCARCHEANAGRPKFLPQVVALEHSGGEACTGCHQPHSPKAGG